MSLEIIVCRKHTGSEQFLLKDGHELEKVLRIAVTDIVNSIRRDRQTVLTCLLCRSLLHDTDHTLYDIIYISKVALAVSVIEDLYLVTLHKLVGESEVGHIRASGRSIYSKETQTGRWDVVKLAVGMGHQLIALLSSGIEGHRIVHLVVSRVRHLLVRAINR